MAPSTTSALNPIVIDPIHVPPHFTTAGSGLLFGSHPREPAASLRSQLTKTRPKSWWRAQCLFYGLSAPEKATIQEMRAVIEKGLAKRGGLVMPEELVDLEHRENGRFRKLNATVREATEGKGTGKGKGKDVLKAVKAGGTQKAGRKTVVGKKGGKVVAVATRKKPGRAMAAEKQGEGGPVAVEGYEGEPMMWPMEMDID